MTDKDLFQRLHELSESDGDGLRKLAEDIGFECRQPARTVLAEWVNGPPERETSCAFICAELKEFAVDEMLRQADSVTPARRVHFMEMVVAQQLAFRELTLTVLEPLLQERSSAGTNASGDELRTCDAAYVLIRRIVRVSAAEAGPFSAENEFVALGREQKDREIEEWTKSAIWNAIFPERS